MDKLLALASEIKKNRSQIQAILETPPEVHHFVGEKGDSGVEGKSASGTALMNFGASNKVAEVIVTGVSLAKTTSIVMSQMRVEATAEHPVDDLQIDPIRVLVKDLVVGTGFTLFGAMDNAPANGTYKIDWHLTN